MPARGFRSRGAVDATIVPEPMHYGAVSALALLTFALLRRKSQRRSHETCAGLFENHMKTV
jgi:hypothetical protein